MMYKFGRKLARNYIRARFKRCPIILGGCPRSGTTLLLSILGSHSRIYAIGHETATLYPRIRPFWLLKWLLLEDKFHLRHIPAHKWRFCEKTPGNLRHTEKILSFFDGNVKIINMFRDGRDVVTSRHPLDPGRYWVSVDNWVNDVRYGLHVANLNQVYTLKYEDLVAEPERMLRDICGFVGEDFENIMISHQNTGSIAPSLAELAWFGGPQKIHADSVNKWDRPEHQARIAEFCSNADAISLSRHLGSL